MTTLEKVNQFLAKPDVERRIDKIIHSTNNTLFDMICFAEWLDRRHNRCFVAYYCKASDGWQVDNADDYYAQPRWWAGEVQWHTRNLENVA